MKASLKIIFKFYKYASIVFLIGFHIYIIIDDWVFIKYNSNASDWALFFVRPLLFTLAYFIVGSIYFWILAMITVFAYQKVRKPMKEKG